MSSSEKSDSVLHPEEKIKAGPGVSKVKTFGYGAGIVLLIAGVAWGAALGDGMQRFLHSYLLAFVYLTSMAVGALFFVIIMYLLGAKWSIVYRRVAECITMAFPLLFLLSIPIWLPMLLGNDNLFIWTSHDFLHGNPEIPFFGEGSHLVASKSAYLNTPFFAIRIILYFTVWIGLSRFFHKTSLLQDENGDAALTDKMVKLAAPAMFLFAFSCAFFGFDMIMSLDPSWFSTMFGVIYFAGACIAIFALLVLIPMALQRSGRLVNSITTEHYHDIGKLLFAFIFFWAYVAFSQFMLIWGANIPEETGYFLKRWFVVSDSMGTNDGSVGPWGYLALALLVFHFAMPFILMMTRYSKRHLTILASFSVWMLVWHYIDLYWQVMPAMSNHGELYMEPGNIFKLIPLDILVVAGMGLLFMGAVASAMTKVNLIAIKDPGLRESLRFENQ